MIMLSMGYECPFTSTFLLDFSIPDPGIRGYGLVLDIYKTHPWKRVMADLHSGLLFWAFPVRVC